MLRLACARSRAFIFVVLCVGLLCAGPGSALAQVLEIIVAEGGGAPIHISDNGPLDINPAIGAISVDTGVLNALLTADASHFQFEDLGAASNSPGTVAGATLLQSGTIQLLAGAAQGEITVEASAVNYVQPPASISGTLTTSAASHFLNTLSGDSQDVTGYYNPTNTLDGHEVPTPALFQVSSGPAANSVSGTASTTVAPLAPPFGLTVTSAIQLSGGSPGALSQLQFSDSAKVTSGVTAAVPEPSSAVALLLSAPVWWLGLRRARVRRGDQPR